MKYEDILAGMLLGLMINSHRNKASFNNALATARKLFAQEQRERAMSKEQP